ncbi:hypothetical protein D3C72_967720 [compost metagenome]
MLLSSKLAGQFVLLHFVGIIYVIRIARFFLSHTLGRQFNPVGRQLATGRNAHAIWTWQLRTDTLFNLRTRRAARSQTERCRRGSRLLNTSRNRCHGCGRVEIGCTKRRRRRRRRDNRLTHWLRHRLIPGRKLLAFTGTLLFHFFKIVHRWTGRFYLFDFNLRLDDGLRRVFLISLNLRLSILRISF